MREFLTSRARSFRHAFAGLGFALRTQPNTWIHALASLAVILGGIWLRLGWNEWALLLLAMGLVWMAELLNSALETLANVVSPQPNTQIKTSKDLAAAAVLAAALFAAGVGLVVLGPPLWARLDGWLSAKP